MDHFDRVGALLAEPEQWAGLSADETEETLVFAATGFALGRLGPEQVGPFYANAMQRFDRDGRATIVTKIGRMCERMGRTDGQVPSSAFLPFIYVDDDFVVVSTAALEMAQTMPASEQNPLAGPAALVELAAQLTDDRKAWVLAGLAALGDTRVSSLLFSAWQTCSPQAQAEWLKRVASLPPTVASFRWFSALIEALAFDSFDVIGTLTRIARVARGAGTSEGRAEGQVFDLERALPSWSVTEDASPVSVKRRYSLGDVDTFAPGLVPGLQALASEEDFPRLLPLLLDALGARDEVFESAVRDALADSENEVSLDGVSVSVSPCWERPDALVEWGILNPFGPTRSQLLAVSVNQNVTAVVFAMHNPFAHHCLVVATVPTGDREALQRALVEVAGQFQFGDVVLMGSLPHWVTLRGDVPLALGSAIFQRMHEGSLALGSGGVETPATAVEYLRRLRDDPVEVTLQGINASELSQGSDTPWSSDDYERWLAEATAVEHVSAVEPNFLECWNVALRLQREAKSDGTS